MPLRWKLVALYALILAGVIATFSAVLTHRLRETLVKSVDTELDARAHTVGIAVEYDRGGWNVEPKAGIDKDFSGDSPLYYLVLDEGGRLLTASPLARALHLDPAQADRRELHAGDRHFRQSSFHFNHIPDDEEREHGMKPTPLIIVCGKDMSPVDFAVGTLRRQLLVIGPLVLLVSLAGGLFLAGRVLKPIDRMARTAEEISAKDLSRRIDVKGRDELARLGRTLNETFERLQESFDRQTRFTADASHELRTPLSVVAGNVELALKRPRTPEEYRDILGDIQDATLRMQSIVEGLLTLARADAKTIPLRRESLSLTSLCDELIRMYRPLAEKNEVAMSVESSGDVVVTGDRERLKELVTNLVTNAIRYNRKGGSVRVRLSREGSQALLAVDDTGIGIPAEDLPHVFERFYRVDKARSREVGGSGLGLAIAKWIVDAHAGSISVTSKPSEGSCFLVSLPA